MSCPKGMRKDYLFGGGEDGGSGGGSAVLKKGDDRLRNIPLDVGRPTLEAAIAVVECLLGVIVREMSEEERIMAGNSGVKQGIECEEKKDDQNRADAKEHDQEKGRRKDGDSKLRDSAEVTTRAEDNFGQLTAPGHAPLTPLHEAVIAGDLAHLMELLQLLEEYEVNHNEQPPSTSSDPPSTDPSTPAANHPNYDVNTKAGPDSQTPLHLASSSTHPNAPSLLNALLLQGRANPCAIDSRGRPPYFLASSDKLRETFRLARGTLGEDYCSWDEGAKVGPPLTDEDVQLKKIKALEKKRRQRARQKEKKANEKALAEEEAAKQREEEERKKKEEDAKRIRAGLQPKTSTATNVCDFCQTMVKGKRRSQMFQRLEYAYCSTECVKRHQRELMAAAATARMGRM